MRTSRPILFISLLILGLACFCAVQTVRLRHIQRGMDELQLQALSQSAEEMQSLTLSLEKLLLSGHSAQQAELLHAIALNADAVQQCLSALPLESEAAAAAMALAGQLQADASALLPTLTQGKLSEQDRSRLTDELPLCSRLSSQLHLAHASGDAYGVLTAEDFPQVAVRQPASPRGLPPESITREEAHQAALRFVGGDADDVHDAPDVSGVLPAYGVTLQSGGVQLNLEITRQGGKVLWMMPETADFPVTHTPEVCADAAADFLLSRGFGTTEAVYQQVYDGLCVVSMVPLQEDVLLYPDLISVQVRMDTLQVVGLEARSYWTNHVSRSLSPPGLSARDAQALLPSEAARSEIRLCLIPSGNSELLCWQCACPRNGDVYLIYLDAQTGEEAAIRKLIPLENGVTAA